jgi:hypothetical protein
MSNNFKELEKLNIQNRLRSTNETKQKINANIHFFGFVSSVLDVYLPKVGVVITSFGTAASRPEKKKYPNQQ